MTRWIVPAFACVSLCGCFGGASRPSRYYLLVPGETPRVAEAKPGASVPTVEIGPVELPKYLDRAGIVSRAGSNQLVVSDFDSWAEPLADGIQRVLVQNIANALDDKEIVIVPRQGADPQTLQVPVSVSRFECDELARCVVRLSWSIRKEQRSLVPRSVTNELEGRAASAAAGDQAEALSRLLGEAAKTIAAALKKL